MKKQRVMDLCNEIHMVYSGREAFEIIGYLAAHLAYGGGMQVDLTDPCKDIVEIITRQHINPDYYNQQRAKEYTQTAQAPQPKAEPQPEPESKPQPEPESKPEPEPKVDSEASSKRVYEELYTSRPPHCLEGTFTAKAIAEAELRNYGFKVNYQHISSQPQSKIELESKSIAYRCDWNKGKKGGAKYYYSPAPYPRNEFRP